MNNTMDLTNAPKPVESAIRPKPSINPISSLDSDLDMLLWRLRARVEANTTAATLIGLTSCSPKSGVSTLATNLSVRAASNYMGPVLIIDGNMGAPSLQRMFKIKGTKGLVDLLVGAGTPEEAIQSTPIDSLDVMPVGSKESLRSGRIIPENYEEIITWIRDRYRTVFIDLPTIDNMRHSLFLAKLCDATIIAVRSDAVRRSQALTAIQRLADDGVKVTGTILTRRRIYTPRWLRNA